MKLAAAALALAAAPALGQYLNPASGHYYTFTPTQMTWFDAEAYAQSLGGHLASITSTDEQNWVYLTLPSNIEYLVWLGGRDHTTGQWTWSSGEPFGFAFWFSQPTVGADEKFATLIVYGSERGAWSAQFGGSLFRGLIETCYANCDNSLTAPTLNVNDFICFMSKYAAGDPYANCDGSTIPPVLNVSDFTCFLNRYAQGCL